MRISSGLAPLAWWRRHWTGIAAVAIVVAGMLVSWMRLPVHARETLWAEDVRIFLGQAEQHGGGTVLFTPYAGYLHTVPRIIAWATSAFVPVDWWPQTVAAASCLVVGIVAAVVFVCSRDVVPWLPARLVVAAVTVLVPLAPREVLGNIANLHWYFLWVMPWLLLYRPRGRVGAWALGVFALLASLTEIQSLIFLPLLLWRWRDHVRWPVRGLYLVGAMAQLTATLLSPRLPSSGTPIGPASLAYGYLINCVMSIWSSTPAQLGRLLTTFGPAAGVVMLVPFLAAAAYGILRGSRLQRLVILTFAAASVLLYVGAVQTSPGAFYDYAAMTSTQLANPWLARYGVVPSMFLLAIVPIAATIAVQRHRAAAAARVAASLPSPTRSRARTVLPWATLVVLVALMAGQLTPAWTRRSDGPLWQPQVAEAQEDCEQLSPENDMRLTGAPGGNWALSIPCQNLDRS